MTVLAPCLSHLFVKKVEPKTELFHPFAYKITSKLPVAGTDCSPYIVNAFLKDKKVTVEYMSRVA